MHPGSGQPPGQGHGQEQGHGGGHGQHRRRRLGPNPDRALVATGGDQLTPHQGPHPTHLGQLGLASAAPADVGPDALVALPVEEGPELERRRVAPEPSHQPSRARWRTMRLRAAWSRDITVPMLTAWTAAISA